MKKIFQLYASFYKKHGSLTILYVIITFAHKGVALLSPLVTQRVVDSAIAMDQAVFFNMALLLIGLTLLFIVLLAVRYYLQHLIETRATTMEKERVLRGILRIALPKLRSKPMGHYFQLVTQDVDNTKGLVVFDFTILLSNIVMVVIMLVYLLSSDLLLSLVVLLVIPVFVIATKLLLPRIEKANGEIIEQQERINNLTDEACSGAESIKTTNSYGFIDKLIHNALSKFNELKEKYIKMDILYDFVFVTGSLNFANVLIYCVGGLRVLQGAISIGIVLTFTAYFSTLWNSIEGFMDFFKEYKVKQISLTRLLDFHSQEDAQEAVDDITLATFEALNVQDISFSYENKSVIQNLSFSIAKGDKMLIIGPNGSGKSTLARILVKLLQAQSGEITYNSMKYGSINPYALRKHIMLVPAEPFLLEGTLRNNFFGQTPPNVLGEEFAWDKPLKKDGSNLSSGERKRIQLMRCLAFDADVYIFDEPFNYVDESAKGMIWNYIETNFSNKTLIVISHEALPKSNFNRFLQL